MPLLLKAKKMGVVEGICVSVFGSTINELASIVKEARRQRPDLIELRLDYLEEGEGEISQIEALKVLVEPDEILTLRSPSEGGRFNQSEAKRVELMQEYLSRLEPTLFDIEIKTLERYPKILERLENSKTQLIASFHDLEGFTSRKDLEKMVARAPLDSSSLYAVKIVRQARNASDNLDVLELYASTILRRERGVARLIAFCTGEKGTISRVLSVHAGSPIVYCSLAGKQTAPGQIGIEEMRRALGKD